MGTLWPKSGLIERDNNDDRAIGALAYFYQAGTTTPKTVYSDAAETAPLTQPATADGNGRWPALFVPFGSYKERRTTSGGASIGSTIDNIPNPEPFDGSVVVDPATLYSTGHISVGIGNETRNSWVRLNGRSIGNAASSATERANADTVNLYTHIYNRLSDTAAPVSGGRGASAAADYAANKRLTLPDWRAAGLRGFDDMGNSAAFLLGSAPVVIGNTITAGSVLGENIHQLTQTEMPVHNHNGTVDSGGSHSHTGSTNVGEGLHSHSVTTTSDGAHTHTLSVPSVYTGQLGTSSAAAGITPTSQSTSSNGAHTHTVTITSDGTHIHTFTTTTHTGHTHTFTSGNTGSGGTHNNVARDALVTFYIKL